MTPNTTDTHELPSEEGAWNVLDRYLAGEAPATEAEFAQAVLQQRPGFEGQLRDPDTYLATDEAGSGAQEPSWTAMLARLAQEKTGEAALPSRWGDRERTRVAWRWVATVGMAILVCVGGIQAVHHFTGKPSHIEAGDRAMRTVATRIGQQVHYRFADGSSVLLAPGTTIQYGSEFGTSDRMVELHGEALFTISPNESAPFIVRTGNSVVRVLGTTFSVRRYTTDTTTNVVVAQGKVSIGGNVLTSGDAATVDLNGATQVERGVDIRTALGWTTGNLAFRRRPLRDIIPDIERWYGLRIHVSDLTLLSARVTAIFPLDAPDRTLDILASVLQADVSRQGDDVMFQSQLRQD